MEIRHRPTGFRRREETSPPSPTLHHGFFKSFDGTKIFYSIEGKGKPLIFCYGLVCSSLHWTYQIDYFRQNYKTIWFDYRGHQNSEVPKDLSSMSIQNLAHDLQGLLDEVEIKDAVFLGHSMGVNVVLELYRQRPSAVRGLVLANGTARNPAESIFHNNLLQKGFEILTTLYKMSPGTVQKFWKLQKKSPLSRMLVRLGGFNPHLSAKEDIDLYVDQVLDFNPELFIHLIHHYEHYDAASWLHEIKAPSLIIAGEKDHIIPLRQQELMHQLIPKSTLEVIHHGSHCTQMDLPDLVNLKIENFLNEIEYASL